MGTLLEPAPSVHCGQWVKYACDPGYSFADKVMENAKGMGGIQIGGMGVLNL